MLTLIITMITVYEIYNLIKSRSITFASLSELTMSNLVDHMTRDNLDTNIITHDRNLIMISFMLCDVSWTLLIDLRSVSIHKENEYQINEYAFY